MAAPRTTSDAPSTFSHPDPSADDMRTALRRAHAVALRGLTGHHAENPTLGLPCRELFARGQKPVRVFGPVPALQDERLAPHRTFWSAR